MPQSTACAPCGAVSWLGGKKFLSVQQYSGGRGDERHGTSKKCLLLPAVAMRAQFRSVTCLAWAARVPPLWKTIQQTQYVWTRGCSAAPVFLYGGTSASDVLFCCFGDTYQYKLCFPCFMKPRGACRVLSSSHATTVCLDTESSVPDCSTWESYTFLCLSLSLLPLLPPLFGCPRCPCCCRCLCCLGLLEASACRAVPAVSAVSAVSTAMAVPAVCAAPAAHVSIIVAWVRFEGWNTYCLVTRSCAWTQCMRCGASVCRTNRSQCGSESSRVCTRCMSERLHDSISLVHTVLGQLLGDRHASTSSHLLGQMLCDASRKFL